MDAALNNPTTAWWAQWLTRPQEKLYRALLIFYFAMLVLLPSGSLFGVNVKVIMFFIVLPLALQTAFAKRQMTRTRITLLIAVPVVFLLWCFLSQLYEFDLTQSLAQYKDLMVTIATCWFATVLCSNDRPASISLLRAIFYIEVFTSALKLSIIAYALLRGIPLTQVLDVINNIFGVQLMPFDISSLFGRLEFISDNLIPLCIFAVLRYRHTLQLRARTAVLALIALLLSDLFSFSRYLWAFSVAALILGLLLGKKDRFQVGLIITIAIGALALSPVLITVIALRFSTKVASASDIERTEQLTALHSFFLEAPWFGHGLGSYTTEVVRSETALYSYEAQIQALFGQIGIIGVALLTALAAYYFRRIWPAKGKPALHLAGLVILLLLWIAGGFLNPSVISSSAAVSYIALYLMANLETLAPAQQ